MVVLGLCTHSLAEPNSEYGKVSRTSFQPKRTKNQSFEYQELGTTMTGMSATIHMLPGPHLPFQKKNSSFEAMTCQHVPATTSSGARETEKSEDLKHAERQTRTLNYTSPNQATSPPAWASLVAFWTTEMLLRARSTTLVCISGVPKRFMASEKRVRALDGLQISTY